MYLVYGKVALLIICFRSVFAVCSSLNVVMYEGPLPMLQGQKGHKDMCSWIQSLCGSTDSWLCGTKRKQSCVFCAISVKFEILFFELWDNTKNNRFLLTFHRQSKWLLIHFTRHVKLTLFLYFLPKLLSGNYGLVHYAIPWVAEVFSRGRRTEIRE